VVRQPTARQELSTGMLRIMSDNDVLGQVSRLVDMCQSAEWVDFWRELGCVVYTFNQLGLAAEASDFAVWEACQANDVLLITANRNAIDPDSLELAIRQRNRAGSLPVLTFADADRVLLDGEYANSVVERLFEILLDIDLLRGTGRLFLP
jgi:hypothetical protein